MGRISTFVARTHAARTGCLWAKILFLLLFYFSSINIGRLKLSKTLQTLQNPPHSTLHIFQPGMETVVSSRGRYVPATWAPAMAGYPNNTRRLHGCGRYDLSPNTNLIIH